MSSNPSGSFPHFPARTNFSIPNQSGFPHFHEQNGWFVPNSPVFRHSEVVVENEPPPEDESEDEADYEYDEIEDMDSESSFSQYPNEVSAAAASNQHLSREQILEQVITRTRSAAVSSSNALQTSSSGSKRVKEEETAADPCQKADEGDQADICTICQDVLLFDLAVLRECGHIFHVGCIHSWMQIEQNGNSAPRKGCPFCNPAGKNRPTRPIKLRLDARPLAKGEYGDLVLSGKLEELKIELQHTIDNLELEKRRTEMAMQQLMIKRLEHEQVLEQLSYTKERESALQSKIESERSGEVQLRRKIQFYEQQLRVKSSEVSTAQKSQEAASKQIDTLKAQIDNLKGENRRLKEKVDESDTVCRAKLQLEGEVSKMKTRCTKLEWELFQLKEQRQLQVISKQHNQSNNHFFDEEVSPNHRKRLIESTVQEIVDEDTTYITNLKSSLPVHNKLRPVSRTVLGAASSNQLPTIPSIEKARVLASGGSTSSTNHQPPSFNRLRPAPKKQAKMDAFLL
jgi:hypothetical protein